jgi:hypothetical protein
MGIVKKAGTVNKNVRVHDIVCMVLFPVSGSLSKYSVLWEEESPVASPEPLVPKHRSSFALAPGEFIGTYGPLVLKAVNCSPLAAFADKSTPKNTDYNVVTHS